VWQPLLCVATMDMQTNATPNQESGAGKRIDGLVRVVEDAVASSATDAPSVAALSSKF
jgi:hypothetical protein